MGAACAAYRRADWRRRERKSVRGAALGDVLGAELDGLAGRVGAAQGRRLVVQVLLRIFDVGYATAHLIDVLLGLLTSCFLYRRPMLAILEEACVDARPQDQSVFRLRPAVTEELQLAAACLLAAGTDMRAPVLPALWSLDASPWRVVVRTQSVSVGLVRCGLQANGGDRRPAAGRC